MTPYYQDDAVVIYHGDCREIVPQLSFDVTVSDPPYPNNAGHFVDAVDCARDVLSRIGDSLIFWTELERPPVNLPLVAVHIWHRTNVNGRPYEPIYHFDSSGEKRRSEVLQHAAIFEGVGPGCNEYLGHPTQKPVALMNTLIGKTSGIILDPFMGSGSTIRAAKDLNRKAIGIEISERYCEMAVKRMSQEVFNFQ